MSEWEVVVEFTGVDQQLCFALARASRAMTGCYRPTLERWGLTYPQYLVMLALWEHDTLTVSQLARILELGSGTLSPLLKRLQTQGLVERTRRATDERTVEVTLTETGSALRAGVAQLQANMLAATGLPMPEAIALRDTLNTLTARLAPNNPPTDTAPSTGTRTHPR